MPDVTDDILAYLDDRTDEIAESLSRLVQIPSVNPYAGDAITGEREPYGEEVGQRCFQALMELAGGETVRVPVPVDIYTQAGILGPKKRSWVGRENLVGRFRFSKDGPVIVLNGHMDTIGVSDFESEPFSGQIDGDIIHGRGTSDCKGGLIAGLYALKALRETGAPMRGTVIFQSVVDEECNGSGAGTLACLQAGYTGRYCLALDGMHGLQYAGCQGIATVEITVRGRAGHGSLGGVSAIDKLLLVKGALDRLQAERAASRPGYSVNIGALRAGVAPWTVPSKGWLTANLNYAREEHVEEPGRHGIALRARLEELLAEVCDGDEWLREHTPEVVWVKDVPGFGAVDLANADDFATLAAEAEQSWVEVAGEPPTRADLPAWADASHLCRIGRMPVIGIGTGEPGTSHTGTESNRISNVRRVAAAVALTMLRLGQGG